METVPGATRIFAKGRPVRRAAFFAGRDGPRHRARGFFAFYFSSNLFLSFPPLAAGRSGS